MNKKDITHATIVPLIGGEVLGAMESLDGKLPEYVMTYSPFMKNDSHFIDYIRNVKGWKGEYAVLDQLDSYSPQFVDVISATCPCAGLSSLSVSSSADSAVNDWLYTTAEYVLNEAKPTVFWGENAPRLYTLAGKKVADKLYDIGIKAGYSLNLYYTESRYHGLAQKRPRTFYFFTKGVGTSPLFNYIRRDFEPINKILQMDYEEGDPMSVLTNQANPMDNPWVMYCLEKAGCETLMDYYNKIDKSTNLIVESDNISTTLHDVADWMASKGYDEKFVTRARSMQDKKDIGKGYWAHGVTMPKGQIPSLIGAMPYSLINPYKNSFLTIRDCLRIMKMPEDFNLSGNNPVSNINMICQNVPVTTAKDMMDNIVDYLAGNCDTIASSYLKQDNVRAKHETMDKHLYENTLGNFF